MDNHNPTKGLCMLMCSEEEIELRQREGLVHVLESRPGSPAIADRRRMVKKFTRSAAGKDMLHPDQLRPPPVLKKTVSYLLSTIVSDGRVSWSTVYSFVTDRLRAVRQDMVIQQPPPATCIAILEPIVRFHAYSAYRLCEEPLEAFDPHLNSTHLCECLNQLLVCYDSAPGDQTMSAERLQMEALYGLLHLAREDALYRILSSQPASQWDSMLSVVLRMSLAHLHNNYVTVCCLLRCLPPLSACVAALHLPFIRRKALSVMNTAYSSKNLRFPLDLLCQILLFSDHSQAAAECRHYNLSVDLQAANVHFHKGSGDFNVKQCTPKRLSFIDDGLADISLPELFLTAGEPSLCPGVYHSSTSASSLDEETSN